MDSNGFKALAFLHFYLCGVVAAYSGIAEGERAFATLIASALLLTTFVLTGFWMDEVRGQTAPDEPRGFAPGAGRAAVIAGWAGLGLAAATGTYHPAYAAYVIVLMLLLCRARSMEADEQGWREKLHADA